MSQEHESGGGEGSSNGEEPVRLRDAGGSPQSAGLAAALASAADEHRPSNAQLNELRRAMGSAMSADGPGTTPVEAAPRLRFGWTGGIAVAMLTLGSAALWFGHGVQTVAPAPIAPPETPPAAVNFAAPPAPEPIAPAAPPEPASAPPATEPAPVTTSHRQAPRLRPPRNKNEVRLVSRAQQALRSNPALALSLAERHRGRFPNGAMAQEREVIAVDALRALHRTTEAQARARKFRARFPDSAYLPRVEGKGL